MTRIPTGKAASNSDSAGPPAATVSGRGTIAPRRIEIGEHRLDDSGVGFLIDLVAELRRTVQPARVPTDVLARHVDPGFGAVMRQHRIVMFCNDAVLFIKRRIGARSAAHPSELQPLMRPPSAPSSPPTTT